MYRLRLKRSAEKELVALHPIDRRRVFAAIRNLVADPRPPGCKKLKRVDKWRIRVGEHRVVYGVDDDNLLVVIFKIGHRRDVYRNL